MKLIVALRIYQDASQYPIQLVKIGHKSVRLCIRIRNNPHVEFGEKTSDKRPPLHEILSWKFPDGKTLPLDLVFSLIKLLAYARQGILPHSSAISRSRRDPRKPGPLRVQGPLGLPAGLYPIPPGNRLRNNLTSLSLYFEENCEENCEEELKV